VRSLKAIESFPAFPEAHGHLERLIKRGGGKSEIVAALESDVGLLLAALRLANRTGDSKRSVASAPQVTAAVPAATLVALIESVPSFGLSQDEPWLGVGVKMRFHALAVRSVAEQLADITGYPDEDEIVTSAMLHDVGKLVLVESVGYARFDGHRHASNVESEFQHFGTDHAEAGAMLARHWKFPERLASAIENHHNPDCDGEAAILFLADQIAHFRQGDGVDMDALSSIATRMGVDPATLTRLLYDLPYPPSVPMRRVDAGPLSERELEVIRLLASGMAYKQIAAELGLSPSTVRSHLHRIYRRLGVSGGTQAVLVSTERGWL
jgi:putative nucleotidyltransferase with HDIG domain